MTQLKISPLLTAALIMCATSARAEVQKFLNPCSGQKLCASYTLVLTPPDGWVVDDKATNENKVQILVPKGQSFDPIFERARQKFVSIYDDGWFLFSQRCTI